MCTRIQLSYSVSFITDTGHDCDRQTIAKAKLQVDKSYTFTLEIAFGGRTKSTTFDIMVESEAKPELTITLNGAEPDKVHPGNP